MPPETDRNIQNVRVVDVSTGHPMDLITFQDAIMRLQAEARAIGRDIADAFKAFHYDFDDLDPGNIEDSAEHGEKTIDFDDIVALVRQYGSDETK